MPSLANSVFAETVQGLAEGLQSAGYELMLAASGYSLQREEELTALSQRVTRVLLGSAGVRGRVGLAAIGREYPDGRLAGYVGWSPAQA